MKKIFSWKKLLVACSITLITFFIFPSKDTVQPVGWVSISYQTNSPTINHSNDYSDPFGLSCLAVPVYYFHGQPLPFWYSLGQEGCGGGPVEKPFNPLNFLIDLVIIYLGVLVFFTLKAK